MPGYGASLNLKTKTQLLALVGYWIAWKYQFLCLLYIDVAWEVLFRHSDFWTFFSQTNMVPEQKVDFSDIFVFWLSDHLKVATLQWKLQVREELHKKHKKKRVWLITEHLWAKVLQSCKYEEDFCAWISTYFDHTMIWNTGCYRAVCSSSWNGQLSHAQSLLLSHF